ncbi:hypothetical protein [uncultured Deinococcus sp.]|uniref:hypothetical protein n=1 Tax=uncultured Deinococcus sp. TaxID=158789 RepID=UPI0025E57456|nr:hypothetical protein [uncultured Deinococcus sp.]
MSLRVNKHGLGRDIPPEVKRLVRQRCGFGCVICGLALVDYEHVDPVFAEARFHDPDAIVLLCPTHHAMVTRGMMSKTRVMEAAKKPAALQRGFTHGVFQVDRGPLIVDFGGFVCEDTPIILNIGGVPLLSFEKPQDEEEPWNMTAIMADYLGSPLMSVFRNEWRISTTRWDVKVEGNRILVRNGPRNIGLKIRHDPGKSIVFEAARLAFAGMKIECREGEGTKYSFPGGESGHIGGGRATKCGGGIMMQMEPEIEYSVRAWVKAQGESFGLTPDISVASYNLRI